MALTGIGLVSTGDPLARIIANKSRVAELRGRARSLYEGGATGVQVAADISASTDAFLVELLLERLYELPESTQAQIAQNSAMIAVGGTGRGELAPYSDADVLFLYSPAAGDSYEGTVSHVVRDCWDAGIELGHSVRTISESINLARQDASIATAIIEARLLWGSQEFFERFQRAVSRKVVRRRKKAFVASCVAARNKERAEHGLTVSQLEPDVKRSLGGLRDVHLIRWVGFAHYGTTDMESLRLKGALNKEDARDLIAAQEFLMRVRIDLHFHAGKSHDVLNRDAQLRIAREREIAATTGQRPVERFMQTYFRHSRAIAEICRRFVASHESVPLGRRTLNQVLTHRLNGYLTVGPGYIDIIRRQRSEVLGNVDEILKLYHSAALYDVLPTYELSEAIRVSLLHHKPEPLSASGAKLFREILGATGRVGKILRSMYATGLLELIVPDMAHARCLLQFNLLHSYTVDEHTLRAIEAAEGFEQQRNVVGTAYRKIRQKDILHLALLLHDLGKGYEADHSVLGEEIALKTAERLHLSDDDRDRLAFLVRHHLKMSHIALRRDINDPDLLHEFSREVGSPETLRLLFVLTAADMTAVAPGVWTDWKAEFLSDLYNRSTQILGGKPYQFLEEERMARIKEHVRTSIVPTEAVGDDDHLQSWIRSRLDMFPPHYLSATNPTRIASDLGVISGLQKGDVIVHGEYDRETNTVDYRIFASENDVKGCFHRACGALSAKRLEILSAQICTTSDGIIVDGFRVVDNDFAGDVPNDRIRDVASSIRSTLIGETAVPDLFQRHKRFQSKRDSRPISELPTRVVLDNNSSDRCTIIDVFAHDRPALLYTIARAIYQMDLSVELAKIATHVDQIVDVFYVTDLEGKKIDDDHQMQVIRDKLTKVIVEFTNEGFSPTRR